MRAKQVAEQLGLPLSSVYRLCQDGKLGHTKLGKRTLIDQRDVDAMLEQGRRPAKTAERPYTLKNVRPYRPK